MEHILEGSCSLSKLWSVDSEERILSVTTLSRKCSIMALAKCNEEGDLISKKRMIILIIRRHPYST